MQYLKCGVGSDWAGCNLPQLKEACSNELLEGVDLGCLGQSVPSVILCAVMNNYLSKLKMLCCGYSPDVFVPSPDMPLRM